MMAFINQECLKIPQMVEIENIKSEIEACKMTLFPFTIEDTSSSAAGLHFIGQTPCIRAAYLKDKR